MTDKRWNKIFISIILLITLIIIFFFTYMVGKPEKICVKEIEIVEVDVELVPAWGRDGVYYYYTWSNGDKEITKIKRNINKKKCVEYKTKSIQ